MGNISGSKAVFIVGASRSGTTLLQMALNAHPDLSIAGEYHYFDQICQIKKEIPSIENNDKLELFLKRLPYVFCMRYIPKSDELIYEVGQIMKGLSPGERTYERYFHELLVHHKNSIGAKRIGEKTPESVRYLPELIEMYPNARIIHIVRDPKSVVSSLLKMPHNSKDVLVHAATWRADVWTALQFEKNNKSKCITIKYEDLVIDTTHTLKKVAKHLDVEFDDRMLNFQDDASKLIKDEPWKDGALKGVYDSSITKWKTHLSSSQAGLIELVTNRLMNTLGYSKAISPSRKALALSTVPTELIKYFQRMKEKRKIEKDESETIFISTERVLPYLLKSFFSIV